jgi:hypothetical protein
VKSMDACKLDCLHKKKVQALMVYDPKRKRRVPSRFCSFHLAGFDHYEELKSLYSEVTTPSRFSYWLIVKHCSSCLFWIVFFDLIWFTGSQQQLNLGHSMNPSVYHQGRGWLNILQEIHIISWRLIPPKSFPSGWSTLVLIAHTRSRFMVKLSPGMRLTTNVSICSIVKGRMPRPSSRR